MIDVRVRSTLCDNDIHEDCADEVIIEDDEFEVARVIRCFCHCHGRPDLDD